MRAIDRKLWRDLYHMRGQVTAICFVVSAGVATFVMSLCTYRSLERTLADYYAEHGFPDVFAHVKRAPNPLADRIREIPGVSQVQTRVVVDVTLDVEGMVEPVAGRLVSVAGRGDAGLCRLYLRRGRTLEPGRSGEALVAEAFAEAHGLEPGDRVRAIINGRLKELTIVGVVLSPEFIYTIRGGEMLPDDKRYGVFWMNERELAAAFDMTGAFNDVCLALSPAASEDEVIARLDRLTERYGGLGSHGRDDQPSNKFVANELKELRGMALVVPGIFLSVAVFLLHVVVARLVGAQREQIATLKAFGYTRTEVGAHYLKFVLLLVLIGLVLGTIAGSWLGLRVTRMYTQFFRFPTFDFQLDFGVWLLAAATTSLSAIAGTLASVRRAARLPPAEAMRPEPPVSFHATFTERIRLQRWLSPAARMVVRRLERQPWKAGLSTLGIALAVAVLILGNFMVDAIDYAMEAQFEVAQRQDVSVSFVEPTTERVLHDLRALPGVIRCEPMRAIAARLRHGHRSRRLGISGIDPEGRLYRLVDVHRRIVSLPPEGLVLSEKLAEVLDVRVGQSVMVEVLEGERPVREIVVVGLIADFSGTAAYLHIDAARQLLREGYVVTGALLSVDAASTDALYRALKQAPRVSAVTIKGVTLRSFRQTIAENLLRMQSFTVLFACVIAVGVVYNTARISLSERSRDLATLRVLGFTRGEVSSILLGELGLLTAAAIPLGLALGYALSAMVIDLSYDTELFRIPLVVSRWTYTFAATVVAVAALGSGLIVRRRLDRLDLVAVLKAPE